MRSGGLRRAALAFGLLLVGLFADTAAAAFPGENGRIAFVSQGADRGANIPEYLYALRPQDPVRDRLAPLQVGDSPGVGPSFSPDGRRIAFSYRGDLSVMRADGSRPRQVTSGRYSGDGYPAFFPSGRRLVFTRYTLYGRQREHLRVGIWSVRINGNGERRLIGEAALSGRRGSEPTDFTVSPANGQIAFSRIDPRDDQADILVMDPDGTDVRRLTSSTTWDTHPDFSPDGSQVLFRCDAAICMINADGTGQEVISEPGVFDIDPVFSPDGEQIAFSGFAPCGTETESPPIGHVAKCHTELYVMDRDGTGFQQLTDNSRTDKQPSWQPLP
jgi:Tol biopolymer transport system component